MSDEAPKKRLGRGLAALIGDIDPPQGDRAATPNAAADGRAAITSISPNRRNPRRHFDADEISELAQSIRVHGLVQPVIVRRDPDNQGRFELIAGERRWRASQEAGLDEIPIVIRDVDDRTALELAIIENVQRADLDPIEEGFGYQALIAEHGYSQSELADVLGKSRSHVANTLRLLRLPDDVQQMLTDGLLSAGHARTLVTTDDPLALARRIVDQGLSVRQAEALAREGEGDTPDAAGGEKARRQPKDRAIAAAESRMTERFGTTVRIAPKKNGGEIRISYGPDDDPEEFISRLMK